MKYTKLYLPRKSAIALAITASISGITLPNSVLADTYVWGSLNGSASLTTTCAASADAAQITFTMLDSAGNLLKNTSTTTKGANGFQTPTCGTLTYDTATDTGSAEIGAFDFFNGGAPAVAAGIVIEKVPTGQDDGSDNLLMANMLFNWDTTNGIPVSTTWRADSLFSEMSGTPSTFTLTDAGAGVITVSQTANSPLDSVEALAAGTPLPGSDGTYSDGTFGYLSIGAVPMTTTEYNTTNVAGCGDNNGTCLGTSPSGELPIIVDTIANPFKYLLDDGLPAVNQGHGGSPMQDGPFPSMSANFDFTSMKLMAFTDATAPTITASGSQGLSVIVPLNGTYIEDGAACIDAAPLGTDLAANLVTTVTNGIGTIIGAVDETTADTYTVTYTCQDNATTTPVTGANVATPVVRTVKVNTTPVANSNFDQTLASDSPLTIDFALGDLTGGELIATDADGDTMTFSFVSATTNGGVVTGNGTGALLYTPAAGYVGPDSFTYTVNDGSIDSAAGTVNLDVTNVLPVAVVDGSSATTTQTIGINVIGNDSDYEDDINGTLATLFTSVQVVTPPTFGSIAGIVGGTINYTAPASIPVGNDDTFTYTVTDSLGGVSTPATTVTVTILAAPNAAPVGADVAYNTDAGTPLVIDFTSVSDTDGTTLPATDTDADALIFTNVTSPTTNGTITGNNSGTLTYTPNDGYNGPDSFTFTADDSKGGVSGVQTVTLTVNNVLPVATDDATQSMLLLQADGTANTLNIDLNALISDLEDDFNSAALTITPVSPSSDGGTVVLGVAAGTVDYTPSAVGTTNTFTYTVTDANGGVSTPAATVTIDVTAAPVTADTALPVDEDTPTTIDVASVASDLDGDVLAFDTFDTATTQGGTVALSTVTNTNDTLTYTPPLNFNSTLDATTDTFTFSVVDANANASTGTSTMTVTVNPIEDAMVCQGTTVTTAVDTALEIAAADLIGTCTDVDGTVSIASYTQPLPATGAITGAVTGPLTFTPASGFAGSDTFTFTATDGVAGGAGDKTYTVNLIVSDAAAAATHYITASNFSMLDSVGILAGGATDVTGTFDERLICDIESCTDFAMTIPLASSQTFSAELWTAHDIRVFGPGTYSFDTACSGTDIAAGTTNCGGTALTLVVGPGQLGAHMLFDWAVNADIDVAVLWDYNASFGSLIYDGNCADAKSTVCDVTHTATRAWNWVSIDGNGNGHRGIPMVDGPFIGFQASFNLDMTAGYTPPLANDDSTSTTPSLLTTIDLLANDSDAEDGAPPVGVVVTLDTTDMAAGSTLVDNLDGTVDYTPDATLIDGDNDIFKYTITDTGGAVSNVATVTIAITATINTAPVANDVTFTGDEDVTLDIDITDVDSLSVAVADDAEADLLTFATFDAASTEGGAITVDASNSILSYTPLGDFNGTDTFTFSVNDGLGDSNVGTMTITVNPVNDAVVCTNVVLGTPVDTALTIVAATDLITGCTDVDGDTVVFGSADQPTNVASTVTDDGAGTLTYTPETGLIGVDSFVFTATDGNGGDGTATANIQVGTIYGNFTMLDKSGETTGGTNDVNLEWDGVTLHADESSTNFDVITIASEGPEPFKGFTWSAHHVRVFGPGTYSFNTGCTVAEIEATGCPVGSGTTGETLTMTVLDGQLGGHMLFDWNTTANIDVVNVWDRDAVWDTYGNTAPFNQLWTGPAGAAPDETKPWELVSRDVNGDGLNGSPMVDGPFIGFSASFNFGPGGVGEGLADIETTSSDTKLGGGGMISLAALLGSLSLIMLLRRRNK